MPEATAKPPEATGDEVMQRVLELRSARRGPALQIFEDAHQSKMPRTITLDDMRNGTGR